MPVGGGEERQVIPLLRSQIYFAVFDKGIYFEPDSTKIQFLDAATGKVSTVGPIDNAGGGICVSPDGAYVVWGQLDRDTRDLMLVENFR